MKPKKLETKTIDDIKCCWCMTKFDGAEAINYDLSNIPWDIECPICNQHMSVWASVEYTAMPIDKDGNEIYE